MIFDFCQCHVGRRRSNKQFISKVGGSTAYPDPAPKKWVGPDREKHMGSTPLYIWLWFGCDLLVAGSAFSACHQPAQYGVLLWTAGTYSPATNKPQWVILSSRRRHGQPAWIYNDMHYIYALTTRSRSVWSGIGGPGGCVIVLPNRNYKWTTADCASHHCFVCENRNIYVWTEHDLAVLVMDGAGENTGRLTMRDMKIRNWHWHTDWSWLLQLTSWSQDISTPPCLPTTPVDTKIIRRDRLMF